MKRKLVAIFILCAVFCTSLFGLTACNETEHVHVYNQRVTSETYLESGATCLQKAKYYFSCKCGDVGSVTFEHGDYAHLFENYIYNNDAKCKIDGTETAVCERNNCNETDTRNVLNTALGHEWGSWKSNGIDKHSRTCLRDDSHIQIGNCLGGKATCTEKATCITCFEKYGTLEEHTYSDKYSFEGMYHWIDSTCGCDLQKDYNKHVIDDNGQCIVCASPIFTIINDIVYEKSSSGIYVDVIGYVGTAIKVEITGEHELFNDISRIRIKKDAFKGNDTIKTLVVSEVVTEIEKGAFANMENLEELIVPFVGKNANSDAFQNESASAEDKAVNSERTIAHFFGTEKYSNSVEVVVQYGAGTTTCYMPITLKKVTVCSSVAYSIPMFAFNGAKNISVIELFGNIDAIGVSSFENTGITNISIPLTVKNIYQNAFCGCNSLIKIYCTAESQPSGWNSNWKKDCSAEVIWGYDGE